ncbi:unnamed protein product [Chrysoparadoxa australica]
MYCQPLYAYASLPGGRHVITSSCAQGPTAGWEHTSVILTSELDPQELEQWLTTVSMQVEVHDRDPQGRLEELKGRWEGLVKPAEEGGEGMEAFEADKVVLEELCQSYAHAGCDCAHAVAAFRVERLLDKSKQVVNQFKSLTGGSSDVQPRVKMTSEACQCKQREVPKGGVEEWHLSRGERLVRRPGSYLEAGTQVTVELALMQPLADAGVRAFNVAAFIFEYSNQGLLQEIMKAMDAINRRALTSIQGSLRAHAFSAKEVEAAEAAELDVICGFMLIDEDCRMVVVEGVAGEGKGMEELLHKIQRHSRNCNQYRVLADPHITFKHRLYTAFNADLKKIRLREPLPILCRCPEIYNRAKVGVECFEALDNLRALRRVSRLYEAAQYHLFPAAAQLLQVESKYGESISLEDIGCVRAPPHGTETTTDHQHHHQGIGAASTGELSGSDASTAVPEGIDSSKPCQVRVRLKAPTDATNPKFEAAITGRTATNFLSKQREVLDTVRSEFEVQRKQREAERAADPVPSDHCYGPQKLNYTELKKEELRRRLAQEKNVTFTYSSDFVSQTVSLVDEHRIAEEAAAESRSTWMTKRGFVFPAPKKPSEYAVHPRKPSQSRIDILREPWVENEQRNGGEPQRDVLLPGQPDFDTVPSNGGMIFGGWEAPRYQRDFDSTAVGSRRKLPRGRQLAKHDPNFFRSVHLVGDGLAKEMAMAKRAEAELWKSKLVVTDTDFHVSHSNLDRPLQVDRCGDILQGPATGKRVAIKPPVSHHKRRFMTHLLIGVTTLHSLPFLQPISIFSSLPFEEARRTRAGAGDDSDGLNLPSFHTYIHRDANKPKSQTLVAGRRKILPLESKDKVGVLWSRQ